MSEGEALRRESWRRAQSVFTRGVPRAGAAAMLAIALATPCTARAQRNAPAERAATRRVVTAYAARTRGAIQLDGKLDEPAWSAAPAESTFTQSYPKPGAPPSERTVFRVLYDGHNLYVGVRAYDTHPDSIAAQLARRDSYGIYSDWIHVVVDSYHDRRTAFRFSVNPLGVEKDALEYNDTNEDLNWDAVWEVATRRDSLGWTAEYRIPLSQLRFGGAPPGGVRTWGFQVQRDIARYNERDSWAPWTQTSPGYVSSFGDLTGLRDIPVPARLELLPYVSARLTRAPGDGADPFYRANAFRPSVGGDLTYGLPGGLTLNATVNPDFGQVEVDPAVVNLSAFETFFPEKRPFFLEGSNIFQFGQVYTNDSYGNEYFFYSRRIGRQPERSVGGPGVLYVNAPDQTAILGATKVTGRAGPWTVGVLDAVTNRETAQYLTTSGVRGTTPVEPLTNYGVARVQRDFGQGTTVLGAMLTATDRSARDTVFSSLLRSRALVGGVDFQHTWAAREWIVSGYAAGSNVSGSRAVIAATQRTSTHYYQRPDAPYLHYDSTRTQLGGYITEVAVAKRGPWFGSLDLKTVSPGLELNDLGFQGRADYRFASLDVGHQWSDPGRVFRNAVVFSAVGNVWNYGGNLIGQYDILGGQGTFNSMWSASVMLQANPGVLDDRLTRGGPLAMLPPQWKVFGSLSSDSRRPVIVTGSLFYLRSAAGGQDVNPTLTVEMRPSAAVRVTLGPSFETLHSTNQYVRAVPDPLATATYGTRYVFADLHQATLSMETRVDWTFTTDLSLQVYAQPFISAGRYTRFKELLAPRTRSFGVYGVDRGTITADSSGRYTVDPDGGGPAPMFGIGNPDFNIRSLRGDAVLRWQYRPGSALFFVWQQQRSGFLPSGNFEPGRDAGAIFRTVPTNVFAVKATFWFAR